MEEEEEEPLKLSKMHSAEEVAKELKVYKPKKNKYVEPMLERETESEMFFV